jgi:hypothetical protein
VYRQKLIKILADIKMGLQGLTPNRGKVLGICPGSWHTKRKWDIVSCAMNQGEGHFEEKRVKIGYF